MVACEPRAVGTLRFHRWCPHRVKISSLLSIWRWTGLLSSVRTANMAWATLSDEEKVRPEHLQGQAVLYLKPWLVNVWEVSVLRVLIPALNTYYFCFLPIVYSLCPKDQIFCQALWTRLTTQSMWFSSCRMSYSSIFSCGLILAVWSLILIYLVFLCTTTLCIAVSYRQIR